MSRSDSDRLHDIEAACEAIASYLARAGIEEDLDFDAIRVRLIAIGGAVKDIDPALLAGEPGIPWQEISRMPKVEPLEVLAAAVSNGEERAS